MLQKPPRILLLGALLVLSSPLSWSAQTTPDGEPLPDLSQFPLDPTKIYKPEEIPEHLRPAAELRGDRVPYAVRAHSLMSFLGTIREESSKHDAPITERFLGMLGLDPESPAARELVDISVEFKGSYFESLYARKGKSEDEQQAMQLETYRLAGKVFGAWLARRESEGWAIDPLLDRLLNGAFNGPTMSASAGTQEEFEQEVAELVEGFLEELEEALGWVPRKLRWVPPTERPE